MLAGAASAVFTSPTGCPDHQGRLPICPMRITSTSTMYIEKARTMREGGSATATGDLPTATARAGRSEPPMARRGWAGCAVAADSWANCQTSRGRQKRSRAARHPIETSAAMMSVSSGPTRFETRNCTTANDTPVTSTAGRISRIRRHPARTTMRYAGMMIENSGSWRPTIADRAMVVDVGSVWPSTGATSRPRVTTGMPIEPKATGAVFASRERTAAVTGRSEERRGGEEWRARWVADHLKKKSAGQMTLVRVLVPQIGAKPSEPAAAASVQSPAVAFRVRAAYGLPGRAEETWLTELGAAPLR